MSNLQNSMVAKESHAPDYKLLIYFAALILFGLVILSFASVAVGIERFNDPNHFLKQNE